jgi:hypothetical protein
MADDPKQSPFRASLQASVAVAGTHPAIPKGERAAIKFWNIVSGIAMLGGVIYAFFGGWYWAPIGIVVGLLIAGANRRSAAQVILNTAANDPMFENEMAELGVLIRL